MPWGRHLGGVPCQVQLGGGTLSGPARGVPCQVQGGYPARGGTLPGGTLPGGTQVGYPQPGQDGGTLLGGTQVGYPPARSGRGTQVGYPPARSGGGYPAGSDTQLGQQKEYSLHSGRYASCVDAGGLSCL